jgi:PadR family transcriptional regulator, regulatory protein PadR
MTTPRLDRGEFGLLLLALLAERAMYGYELVAELRSRTNQVIDLPEGTIYPALRRLERKGLVVGRWVGADGAPRRRYYDITVVGSLSLDEGVAAWKRFASAAGGILGT